MNAVVITQPGGVESLDIREAPSPTIQTDNQVRVRVHAAALNRADILQRKGRYPAPPGVPPDIPGIEFAGEVDQVGPAVTSWLPGQRVFGICGGGAQADYVVVPANHLAAIPENLDWQDAAAVPEVFITAHDALFTQAQLTSSESVLVHAAGSGVGTAAIQLGKAIGARVFGTSRSTWKLERAKEYGLDGALVVEDDPINFVSSMHDWTEGRGVDVVLDLVGARYLEANLESLAVKGRMMFVGTTSGAEAPLNFGVVMSKRLT